MPFCAFVSRAAAFAILCRAHRDVGVFFYSGMAATDDDRDAPAAFEPCRLLNVSQCRVSEQDEQFVLTLYNPLSRPVTEHVRLPVTDQTTAYAVIDPDGRPVATQSVPLPAPVLRVPGRRSAATAELVFRAVDLPALGYKSYLITRNGGNAVRRAGERSAAAATERQPKGPAMDVGDAVRSRALGPSDGSRSPFGEG